MFASICFNIWFACLANLSSGVDAKTLLIAVFARLGFEPYIDAEIWYGLRRF
jgi:hypothetical protein